MSGRISDKVDEARTLRTTDAANSRGWYGTDFADRSPRDAVLDSLLEAILNPALFEPGGFENQPIEPGRGRLVAMSPQRWPHAAAVEFLTDQLIRQLGGRYAVRAQLPFATDSWSESDPDLAVAHKDPTRRKHPSELLLLIEVVDSSLRIDHGLTRAVYASAGVPEYWIVDITEVTVEVHTQPTGGSYASVRTLRAGDVLRPTLLPEVSIPVADIPR